MKKLVLGSFMLSAFICASAQISITTVTSNVNTGVSVNSGVNTFTTTNYNSNTNTNYSNGGRDTYNNVSFSPGAGNSNGSYTNGYNTNYGNNGYNYGYNYNNNNGYYNNSNTYNYNDAYNNQGSYTTNNDGYGSTTEIVNVDGSRTIIETTTDSTQMEQNKSIRDKIKSHLVHFTGLVMSDVYDEGNLSKAYVMDKYSELLAPGKYPKISTTLPNSTAFTFDGIAVPPGTKLIIYSGANFTGTKLVEITGPAIINNSKWEFDERYQGANRKTYISELQSTFPQNVRQWSKSNMHDWQNGSIEIIEIPE